MTNEILMLSRLSEEERTAALKWFARQGEEVRVRLMKMRFHAFHRLRKNAQETPAPIVDYCAFLKACRDGGWEAERRFHSSRALTQTDAKKLAANRLAKAKGKSQGRARKRELIVRHWGKVVELRSEGVSYRKISRYLKDEHRIEASHTFLRSLMAQWDSMPY
ncbi:MAG: hypothetical protein ABIK45_05280 [Pseudomonadota bacterium]